MDKVKLVEEFLDSLRSRDGRAQARTDLVAEDVVVQGLAKVSGREAVCRRIYEKMAEAERNHDYARTGIALIIDLDRVEGWMGMTPDGPVGRVRMLRDAGK